MDVGKPDYCVGGQETILLHDKEGKRTRPTPTLVPPPNSCIPPPPPRPPRGREGGGRAVYILLILHTTDSAPHAESTTYSRKFGVGAGDT